MRKFTQFLVKHKKYIMYLIVGVLTTVINYTIYLLVCNLMNCSAAISNIIAWLIAIVFSFVVNKYFVFISNNRSKNKPAAEFLKFLGCRIVSGGLETGIVFVTVDMLNSNGIIWKLIASVFVIIFNYFGSDLFVFRNKA